MTVPAPPSLGSVPSPAPTTADPDNFDARADAFHQVFPDLVNKALPAMLAWIKAAADMIKGWAGVAQDSASTARAESGKAATSAAQAASGASTAVAGANAAGASATAAAASQTAAKGSADAAKLSADQAASSAGVASSGGIRWDRAQTLTAAERAQAMSNLGVLIVGSVSTDLNVYRTIARFDPNGLVSMFRMTIHGTSSNFVFGKVIDVCVNHPGVINVVSGVSSTYGSMRFRICSDYIGGGTVEVMRLSGVAGAAFLGVTLTPYAGQVALFAGEPLPVGVARGVFEATY